MFLAYQLLILLGAISYAVSALVTETAFQSPLGLFSEKQDKKPEDFISIKVSFKGGVKPCHVTLGWCDVLMKTLAKHDPWLCAL